MSVMPQPIQKAGRNHLQKTGTSTHAIGSKPDVLIEVMNPNVNLALWQRPVKAEILGEISMLQASDLRDVRRLTSLTSFDDDVCLLFQQQGLDPQDFKNLRADMRLLAGILGRISGCRTFQFRLVTIAGDECHRFHLDCVPLRLICTYRGPGTEWLTDPQVDRAALARSASNEAVIRFGKPSQFEKFWVGIMKGGPTHRGQGLVHRSPPCAGSGQIRVLFCLDCDIPPNPDSSRGAIQ